MQNPSMEITPFTNLTITFSNDSLCLSDKSTENVAQVSIGNTVKCWTQTRIL